MNQRFQKNSILLLMTICILSCNQHSPGRVEPITEIKKDTNTSIFLLDTMFLSRIITPGGDNRIHKATYGDSLLMNCQTSVDYLSCFIKKDLDDGVWVFFKDSSFEIPVEIYNLKNHKLNGFFMRYFNGKIVEYGNYLNDVEQGMFVQYFTNGLVKETVSFDKGKESGIRRAYSKTGALVMEQFYKNGAVIEQRKIYDSFIEQIIYLKDTFILKKIKK